MLTFANFNMAFPKAGEDVTGITKFIVSQSLSDDVVVFAGKINSLDDFVLNFTGRNGIERFMNSGMVANIINARTVPYSTYGTGLSVIRDQDPGFTFVIRDPNNHADDLRSGSTVCGWGSPLRHGQDPGRSFRFAGKSELRRQLEQPDIHFG